MSLLSPFCTENATAAVPSASSSASMPVTSPALPL